MPSGTIIPIRVTANACRFWVISGRGLKAETHHMTSPVSQALRQKIKTLELPDGRTLDYIRLGAPKGLPLVCHHGTPGSSFVYDKWEAAAAAADITIIAYSRPGYGLSTRHPGRQVADAVSDTAHLLDSLDMDTFITAGWSGGGPHAIACAALMPDRCKAAASLAGVAPYGAPDLDFMAGMGEENIEEFSAALEGEDVLRPAIADAFKGMREVTGPDLADAFGSLIPPVDKAAFTEEVADTLAASIRWGLHVSMDGWVDDDLAFCRDWGVDLASIKVPIAIWQGDLDKMVPGAHGPWLHEHIPGSTLYREPDHGHISLITDNLPKVLEQLKNEAS
ncbi:MAG: alpha/beta hydrolase [Alphaproteobacteria bacterium]|nr:MAG: alpha/beta hydrolase [Alphaproteobacteria bacterium]